MSVFRTYYKHFCAKYKPISMVSFSEILSILMEKKGIKNPTELAKLLGYSSSEKVQRLIRDSEAKPSFQIIFDIITAFPDINPAWVVKGVGNIFLTNGKANGAIPKSVDKDSVTTAPLISQYAHAGYMKGYADEDYLEAQPMYVAKRKYSGGKYIAFEIRGDSMDDGSKRAICHGDVVLGRELYRHYWTSKLHVPMVFIIVHKQDGIVIKEVVDHNLETGIITCHSFNPEYEDFNVNLDDVMQLFYIKEISRDVE